MQSEIQILNQLSKSVNNDEIGEEYHLKCKTPIVETPGKHVNELQVARGHPCIMKLYDAIEQ